MEPAALPSRGCRAKVPHPPPLLRWAQELTRYETTGEIGEGEGVRAGTAYRLPDGRMIYVPEE